VYLSVNRTGTALVARSGCGCDPRRARGGARRPHCRRPGSPRAARPRTSATVSRSAPQRRGRRRRQAGSAASSSRLSAVPSGGQIRSRARTPSRSAARRHQVRLVAPLEDEPAGERLLDARCTDAQTRTASRRGHDVFLDAEPRGDGVAEVKTARARVDAAAARDEKVVRHDLAPGERQRGEKRALPCARAAENAPGTRPAHEGAAVEALAPGDRAASAVTLVGGSGPVRLATSTVTTGQPRAAGTSSDESARPLTAKPYAPARDRFGGAHARSLCRRGRRDRSAGKPIAAAVGFGAFSRASERRCA
jgi:hypothetical protein